MWNVHAHLWKSLSEPPLLQIPGMTPTRIYSLVCIRSRHGASGHFVRKHERDQTSQSKRVNEMGCQNRIMGWPQGGIDGGKSTITHIVATLHAGFHYRQIDDQHRRRRAEGNERTEPGWKSDIEKQIFLSG